MKRFSAYANMITAANTLNRSVLGKFLLVVASFTCALYSASSEKPSLLLPDDRYCAVIDMPAITIGISIIASTALALSVLGIDSPGIRGIIEVCYDRVLSEMTYQAPCNNGFA